MLKVLSKLLFITIVTSFSNSELDKERYFFIGHAYGSHADNDRQLDPTLINFIKENSDLYDTIVLGGDFIYNCDDDLELERFLNFLDTNNVKYVIGNHENCNSIINLTKTYFGGLNYFEEKNDNLIFFLNTSIGSYEESDDLFNYFDGIVQSRSPNNILIFTHELIFSNSDFYVRTNSRKNYEFGNYFYNKIKKKYFQSDKTFNFISGDIGAFSLTPFSFYHSEDNFNLFASGIGNKKNYKGILINVSDNIAIQFIDIVSGVVEPVSKYNKSKVQIYQFPKLILSIIRKNIGISFTVMIACLFLYLCIKRILIYKYKS